MNQIVYNSFPRSGNVFSGYAGAKIIEGDYATVHIPEIFSVKEIDTVTIFRKPSDAIASLINKQQENSEYFDLKSIDHNILPHIDLYKKYMKHAKENKEHIYIARFEDLIGDPITHFLKIAKMFNRTLLNDYKYNFTTIDFSGPIWEDRYDGHIPRKKTDDRLILEKAISSNLLIKQLDKDYQDFINQNITRINL
jgi:hypothetical protein